MLGETDVTTNVATPKRIPLYKRTLAYELIRSKRWGTFRVGSFAFIILLLGLSIFIRPKKEDAPSSSSDSSDDSQSHYISLDESSQDGIDVGI